MAAKQTSKKSGAKVREQKLSFRKLSAAIEGLPRPVSAKTRTKLRPSKQAHAR